MTLENFYDSKIFLFLSVLNPWEQIYIIHLGLIVFVCVGIVVSVNNVYAMIYTIILYGSSAIVWGFYGSEFIAIILFLVYLGAVVIFLLFTIMMVEFSRGVNDQRYLANNNSLNRSYRYEKFLVLVSFSFFFAFFHQLIKCIAILPLIFSPYGIVTTNGRVPILSNILSVTVFSPPLNTNQFDYLGLEFELTRIGLFLYTNFSFAVIGSGMILLLAVVACVALSSEGLKHDHRKQNLSNQVFKTEI